MLRLAIDRRDILRQMADKMEMWRLRGEYGWKALLASTVLSYQRSSINRL